MSPFLFVVIIGIAVTYIGGPILIYFTQKMKARPRFETLEPSQMPGPVADYVYSTANALRDAGFTPESYLCLPDAVPNVKAYLILLANHAAGDKAMVTALMSEMPDMPATLGTVYVEFSTRYASGRLVDTMNSRQLSSFPALPHEVKNQFPAIQDPLRLYEIHRHIMAKHAGIADNDRKVMFEPGSAAAYLAQVMAQGYEEQAAVGIMRRTVEADEEIYRPTWYGAFRMTWGLMFPFQSMRRAAISRKSAAILDAFRRESSQTPV